jgi:hypothetical protein
MEAAVDAADRSGGDDFGRTRWAVIEGLLDTWIAHRHLMRMSVQDLAPASDADVYRRFRDAMGPAGHLIAGPGADPTCACWRRCCSRGSGRASSATSTPTRWR